MPVLNQFIYKFKLDSKLDYNLFLFGLLAKILIIIIFSSALSDDLFFPFVNYFVESNLDNPFRFFFNEFLNLILMGFDKKLIFGTIRFRFQPFGLRD